ncbi:MAG: hypothetical protein ABJA67_03720 [Chthonomonadales bacterium]
MALYSDSVAVKVQVGIPPAQDGFVFVLARIGKGPVMPLATTGVGIFQADLKVGKEVTRGPQTVCLIAYLTDKNDRDKQRVAELEKSMSEKPYEYNPTLHAGKNRADLKLTVLEANPR